MRTEVGGEPHPRESADLTVEGDGAPHPAVPQGMTVGVELLDPDLARGAFEVDSEGLFDCEKPLHGAGCLRGVVQDFGFGNIPVPNLGPDPRDQVCEPGLLTQGAGLPRKRDCIEEPSGARHQQQLPGDRIENRDASIGAAVPQGDGRQQSGRTM